MIPDGWRTFSLGEVVTFRSGGTPSKQTPSYWGGDFPWVSAKDLKKHYIDSAELHLTKEGREHAKIAPLGAVLILVRGMTLLKDIPIGYVSSEVAFNQDIKALISNRHVDSLFISFLLVGRKQHIRSLVNTANHGTGRLDTNLLSSLPLSLPPLQEQRRIAEILSTWDRAIEVTEKLIANSEAQKKALMQKLLTGKERLPGFEGEWCNKSIKDMGSVSSGGTPNSDTKEYWDGNILWATPTDITALQTRYISKTKRHITSQGLADSSAKLLPKGSLLVCTRATIGDIAIASAPICTNQGFKNVSPYTEYDSEFLYYLFLQNTYAFVRLASGSTFAEISKKDFEHIAFPIPELKEQKAIAHVLSVAFDTTERLRTHLRKFQDEKAALMQQLLTGKRRVKIDKEAAV